MKTTQANFNSSHYSAVLPKEVAALIHHVELNKAGWWDKSVQRLVLAAIWLAGEPLSADQIADTLTSEFRLNISSQKLMSVLETLDKQDSLVRLPEGKYRIPDAKRTEFEGEVLSSENAEQNAKNYFGRLIQEQKLDIDRNEAWTKFSDEFLAPLIKEVGANAYRLVTGQNTLDGMGLVDQFLKNFPKDQHESLAEVARRFLNPKSEDARSHISRSLHARLCVEASGLPEDVVNRLKDSSGKPIRFRVFVDTNFLFSLMDLHVNPSNANAKELQELIAHLRDNLKIELFVTPATVEEAKTAIRAAKSQLYGIPTSGNFTTAALHAGLSGMSQKFLMERSRNGKFLSADEWFQPYVENFVAIAKSRGIELYNESQDALSTRQDVIDDILQVMDFEKSRPERSRKSYDRVQHDMVLWHFVRGKIPAYVETPIDAREWILTVDFRFIGFDQHKMRQTNANTPVCLHPTSLIQLLQFWVPRTKEFEKAMLGSLRLPFLFQEFDADAERTTLKILSGLGRYEGSSDFSHTTISSVIMNDGLRAVLATDHSDEEEVALIRDALVEETNKRIKEEKAKTQKLEAALEIKDQSLSEMAQLREVKDNEINSLQGELGQSRAMMSEAESDRASQAAQIRSMKEKEASRNALLIYVLLLTIVLTVSGVVGWISSVWAIAAVSIIGQKMTMCFFAVLAFIAGHLLLEICVRKHPLIHELWPFEQLRNFRRWLWSLVVLGFALGIYGNIVANDIQKNIDQFEDVSSFEEPVPTFPDDNTLVD